MAAAGVVVVAGGPSSEHEVSLDTGAELLALVRRAGRSARPAFVSRDNAWSFGTPHGGFAEAARTAGFPLPAALSALAAGGETLCIALHGRFGEDGELQRQLEARGIRFTGSGSHASEIGMDKELSKLAAAKLGAPCAAHEVVARGKTPVNRLLKLVGLPCIVKPRRGGSSVGVSAVREEAALAPALRLAEAEDPLGESLVESFVPGTEVTCGVLRRAGAVTTLPLVAIRPAGGGLYDYRAKYVAEDTHFQCPADLPADVAARIAAISAALYEALELRGVARVDWIVRDGNGEPVFLELNTLPGFTSHSLVPRAAEVAGLGRLAVVEALLADAEGPR